MDINWHIKQLTPEEQRAAERLTTELDISPVAARILAGRGLRTGAEARAYIRPSLDSLHDPFLMRDMGAAVDRLCQAIDNHERIMVSPEKLHTMKAEEITAAINRDLYEDAWERQREQPVSFRGKYSAEKLETALFLCPKCKKFGTLHSCRDTLTCDCGLRLRVLDTGFFDPPEPFSTVAQWEDWQQSILADAEFLEGTEIFRDSEMELYRVSGDHKDQFLANGDLILLP
ncbi:MAG: hypothetical protein IIU10_00400, partial [Paludibacteraceae bacterium]|nr:hypothetical protein [Paludibacteraceae bacterium]